MELSNAELFGRKAQNYWRSRPRYAEAFFDFLELTAESRIAEMGAGTGVLTRELLRRGAWVYAVEPNSGMRSILERDTRGNGRCVITDGFAERSGLPDGSVNLVIAAQAFHWFEPEKFKAECRRILGGGGRVVLVWNTYRAGVPLIEELDEILKRFCPKFRGFHGGLRLDECRRFFDGACERRIFPNDLNFEVERFVNRCLSSSYALGKGDPQFDRFFEALLDFFYRHQTGERILLPNDTVAYSGAV